MGITTASATKKMLTLYGDGSRGCIVSASLDSARMQNEIVLTCSRVKNYANICALLLQGPDSFDNRTRCSNGMRKDDDFAIFIFEKGLRCAHQQQDRDGQSYNRPPTSRYHLQHVRELGVSVRDVRCS
jgi:hypothetical protein